MKNCPVAAKLFHADTDRHTDIHEEASSNSSQFCESAWKPKAKAKLHHKTGHKILTGIYVLKKQNILDKQWGNRKPGTALWIVVIYLRMEVITTVLSPTLLSCYDTVYYAR